MFECSKISQRRLRVQLEYEKPGQDGYAYPAVRVSEVPHVPVVTGVGDGGSEPVSDGTRPASRGWFAYASLPGHDGGLHVEVDGEVFDSTDDPNLAAAIRDFLSRIDPDTGYIG